jgi:serine protease Do
VNITLEDGRSFTAENLGFDRESDLGLVRITGGENLPAAKVGDSSTLTRGEWVLAMGHPLGQKTGRPPVLRIGRVTSLLRSREKPEPERIGTDAPLISGDSGGPLFDLNGRVVGINSMITSPGRRMASIHVPVNLSKAAIEIARRGERPSTWDGPSAEFTSALREAESALRSNDAATALKAARRAVAEDPNSASAQLILARALARNRQVPESASALAAAIDRGIHDIETISAHRELDSALRHPAVKRVLDRTAAFNGLPGQRKGDRNLLTAIAEAEGSLSRGFVRIRSGEKEIALGTVMSTDGDVLSKASELPDGPIEAVLPDGRSVPLRKLGTDSAWDLALLKVSGNGLQPISPAQTMTAGRWTLTPDSAGALAAIGMIGVTEMPISGRGIAIRATSKAYMGVRLEPIPDEDLKSAGLSHGVRVVVEPDLPASRAGMKDGDVVVEADGKPVRDPDVFMDLMVAKQPGDSVTLAVARGEEKLKITINLAARPAGLPGRGGLPEMLSGDVSRMQGPFPHVLHHDAILRPNQMGGPLLDVDGKLLGINIARADRTSTYAIPARDVISIYERLKAAK